jgi:hypothetical protein
MTKKGPETQLIAAPAAIWVGKCQTEPAACFLCSLPRWGSLCRKTLIKVVLDVFNGAFDLKPEDNLQG